MPEREQSSTKKLSPKEEAQLRQQLVTKRFSADELARLATSNGFRQVTGNKHRRFESIKDPRIAFQIPFRPGRFKDVSTQVQKEALGKIFPDLLKKE